MHGFGKLGFFVISIPLYLISHAVAPQGFRDGTLGQAEFNAPFGVVLRPDGDALYVADDKNHRIRLVSLGADAKVMSVVGRGLDEKNKRERPPPGSLCRPHGLGLGADGSVLIADSHNHRIIRAMWNGPDKRFVPTVLAGFEEGCSEGKAAQTQFRYPYSVVGAPSGVMYVADTDNHRIVRIYGGQTVTIAGGYKPGQGESGYKNGPARDARFLRPTHILLSSDGNSLIVTDHGNQCIRRINDIQRDEKTWVETLCGVPGEPGFRDGPASQSLFNNPYSCTWLHNDSSPSVLISDLANHRLRVFDPKTKSVSTLYGSAAHERSILNCPVSAVAIATLEPKQQPMDGKIVSGMRGGASETRNKKRFFRLFVVNRNKHELVSMHVDMGSDAASRGLALRGLTMRSSADQEAKVPIGDTSSRTFASRSGTRATGTRATGAAQREAKTSEDKS